jgi:DNA replication protein DnaC
MQFSLVSAAATAAKWHEQIGDPTIADGILDRLVHNAHHMELRGESIRKTKTVRTEPETENPSSP